MNVIIFILVWLLTSVLSYILHRKVNIKEFGEWTIGDRIFTIVISIFGPFSLFVNIVIYLLTIENNTPAKW